MVGGIPTPLKNDGVRQLGWWHFQYDGKVIQNSMVPVTTNQERNLRGNPMGLPGLPSSWEWEMRQNYDARMVKILRSVSEAYSDAGWCF